MGGEVLYRAVIVDDEPLMLEGLRLMIDWQACGFELCGEAGSAQEALHLVDTLRPHLLITDVRMPGMLGTDLAALVSRYHPEILILFFSAYMDFIYAQSAINSHAFAYLVKPIDADEMHTTLHRVKDELDSRLSHTATDELSSSILRDQVLRRIALGDDTPESIMRASVLMNIHQNDPCYCAVLSFYTGQIPSSVRFLMTSCGGRSFQLSPKQYGIGFQQIEHDLPMLSRLNLGLNETLAMKLSLGSVHRGADGFVCSLREALDAQGVLFESYNGLRLYHCFNEETAAWLKLSCLWLLHESLLEESPQKLLKALASLKDTVAAVKPSLFSLRYMAASLDAMLLGETKLLRTDVLRDLWQNDHDDRDTWLDALFESLSLLHQSSYKVIKDDRPAIVESVLEILRNQYSQPLSMGSVAQSLHMNPAYLGQLVRRSTGITFNRNLLMIRIERACLMLRQTSLPVLAIAGVVGFKNVDYFSQQFRKLMGMSPIAFRGAESSKEDEYAKD